MNDAPTWIQAVSAIAQALIGLATLLLSWVLWRNSKRHTRLDYIRTIQESWNQLNVAIFNNPKLAAIADKVFDTPPEDPAEEARLKRYLAFFSLNILEGCYLGQQAGLVDDVHHFEGMCELLDPLLRDPEIAKLLSIGGYHSDFVAFCYKRISNLSAGPNIKG